MRSPFAGVGMDQAERGDRMGRVWIAIRAFFAVLFSGRRAAEVKALLAGRPARVEGPPARERKRPPKPERVVRSEAISLLATLQREARLVDFIKEPLDDYTDAQIGAAVRDIHRDCAAVLERLFGLEPVVDQEEGTEVEVPAGFDSGRFRLTGNVTGQPPFRGRLVHHGWEATRCELPEWSGSPAAACTVAPAEVELP